MSRPPRHAASKNAHPLARPRLVLSAAAVAAGLGGALHWAGLPAAGVAFGRSHERTASVATVDRPHGSARAQRKLAVAARPKAAARHKRLSPGGRGAQKSGSNGPATKQRRPLPAPSGQQSAPGSGQSPSAGAVSSSSSSSGSTGPVQQSPPLPPPPSPLPDLEVPQVTVPEVPEVPVPELPSVPIQTPTVPDVQVPSLPVP